ncbi:MAG: hypothetical protein IPL35_09930 [Sphingobacteriales bacterium]|nr:hypothetical protein [Sphingobacteriales bacterium]
MKKHLAVSYIYCGWLLLMAWLWCGTAVQAQHFQTNFGKNRVQYHDYEWSFYESDNFLVYFYQGGQDLAKYTLAVAETAVPLIESKLEHRLSSKIELLVYHNNSDLRQTNIGGGMDNITNSGGTMQIVGNKVFVYFNGDHEELSRQIKRGIAKVYFDNLLFGTTLQEIVQNAVLLNLPVWFVDGLVAHIGSGWNEALDHRLHLAYVNGDLEKFHRLQGDDAAFAGQAFWHYITTQYGDYSVPNILYLTRIHRSSDNGFIYVLGKNTEMLIEEWKSYLQANYADMEWRQDFSDDDLIWTFKQKRSNIQIDNIQLNPKGQQFSYASNDNGLLKVFVYDTEKKRKKRLLRSGMRSYNLPVEHNYPLLAWSRSGDKMAIVYEKRDRIILKLYEPDTKKSESYDITKFQQVAGLCFTDNNNELILSAMRNGQMDLFTYTISSTKVTPLTNDFFDDLDPAFVKIGERRGVVFASNRYSDTLRVERFDSIMPAPHFDIFFYDFSKETETQQLTQLSHTPLSNERQPYSYDTLFTFLSDDNGINNRHLAHFDSVQVRTDTLVYFKGDSVITNPAYSLDSLQAEIKKIVLKPIKKEIGKVYGVSDYMQSIEEQSVTWNKEGLQLVDDDKKYKLYRFKAPQLSEKRSVSDTPYKAALRRQAGTLEDNAADNAAVKKDTALLISNNQFYRGLGSNPPTNVATNKVGEEAVETSSSNVRNTHTAASKKTENPFDLQSEFDWLEAMQAAQGDTLRSVQADGLVERANALRRSRVRTYAPKFAVDYVVAQFDNSIVFNEYENFQTTLSPGIFSPELDGFLRFGTSDLFEDYKVVGGFRLPVNLNGSEYFAELQNLKKRLDKKIFLYRKSEKNSFSFGDNGVYPVKNITLYAQGSLIYPLDMAQSFRLHGGYRNDRVILLSTDYPSMLAGSYEEDWANFKLEYIYDNTIPININILNGTRLKIYTELRRQFDMALNDTVARFKLINPGTLGIVGFDARHYEKIHRNIIWASRLTGAASFGNRKMIYYLGAVDNWLVFNQDRRFDYSTPIDYDAGYAYQAMAPNLRGFKSNVRNGSNFLLLNTELRIPLFAYFSAKPIRSKLLQHFQVVGFFDAGTAWAKGTPWSAENRYYTYQYGDPAVQPVVVQVNYFKDPIVYGYGFGVRSKIFGYFAKVDWAWGIDNGKRSDRFVYLSLGTDF